MVQLAARFLNRRLFKLRSSMTSDKTLSRRRKIEARNSLHKTLLLKSVEDYVLPALSARGFEEFEESSGDRDREKFPFRPMRRRLPDGTVQLVEIQFQSHGRAAFRVNASAIPKTGIMTVGGHRLESEVTAGGLHDHFEMYKSPRFWKWFAIPFWQFRQPYPELYKQLTSRVVTYLPEIDEALRGSNLGPHIRHIQFPINQRK